MNITDDPYLKLSVVLIIDSCEHLLLLEFQYMNK